MLYMEKLLPKLVENCEHLLRNGFIFQQDGAPGHTARVTQDRLKSNCSDFITKDECLHSTDLRPLDYHVWGSLGATLEFYYKMQPKPKQFPSWKLQLIWSALPQKSIDKAAVKDFRKRPQA